MLLSPQLVGSVQIVAGLVALVFLKPAIDNTDTPGSWGYAVFTLGTALWMFGLGWPKFTANYVLVLSSYHVLILGTELAATGALLMALGVSDRMDLVRRATIVLGGGILLFQLLLWTNHVHHIVYEPGSLVVEGRTIHDQASIVAGVFGWWWWAHTAVSFLCAVAGQAIMLRGAIYSSGIRRKQFAWLSLIGVPILSTSIISTLRLFNLPYNVSSVGFLLAVPILAGALFQGQFLDIAPVARRTAMQKMDAAVITLDERDRVIDVNSRARELFDYGSEPLGMPAREFFSSVPESVFARFTDEDDAEANFTVEIDGQQRHFSISISSIGDQPRQGRIILLYDITAQKRREQELEATKQSLEQSNEKLEQFASIVSHDLRNPLNVAMGRLELVREELDNEHVDAIARSHDRMESLIDDTLTLARAGKAVSEMEAVDLSTVIQSSWHTVDTEEATLVVETDRIIQADESRLQQLFENLIRNAVEHGSSDVTVTIGDQHDGFYIEDDGPGIPEGKREEVFETGHSTAESGTGLGLSTVKRITEAHGWNVGLTTGSSNGARFEFTGVTTASIDG